MAIILIGCDATADREIKRAEQALDEALNVSADAYAPDDYSTAEELFQEAVALARDNRILEARNVAINAKLRAEDARKKAEERHKIMEEQSRKLGR